MERLSTPPPKRNLPRLFDQRTAAHRLKGLGDRAHRNGTPAPVPTRRFPTDEDFAEAEELYARLQRRELTPEETAKQNDLSGLGSRRWSSRPPVGVGVRARMSRRTCRTGFGSYGDSAFR
jgi:hypothetical protein